MRILTVITVTLRGGTCEPVVWGELQAVLYFFNFVIEIMQNALATINQSTYRKLIVIVCKLLSFIAKISRNFTTNNHNLSAIKHTHTLHVFFSWTLFYLFHFSGTYTIIFTALILRRICINPVALDQVSFVFTFIQQHVRFNKKLYSFFTAPKWRQHSYNDYNI